MKINFDGMEVVPDWIENYILKNGICTGSMEFGVSTEKSDFDICIPFTSQRMNVSFLSQWGRYKGSNIDDAEFDSIYLIFSSIKQPINLLICNTDRSFLAWKMATKVFKKWVYNSEVFKTLISEKETRIFLFEKLFNHYFEKYGNK
jgi:hypothetical protein